MAVAIISDIHGNYTALRAVVKEINQRNIQNVICLGDICGYYSQVNECIELVQDMTDKIVIGNHDKYIINNTKCPHSNSVNVCLDYQRKVLKSENIDWLRKFPTNAKYFGINCVHGSWENNLDEYIKDSSYFEGRKFIDKVLISGHSHIPFIYKNDEYIYCNSGSVGQPRDGDYRASFAIFDNYDFEIVRVAYDYSKTQHNMKQCGFDIYYYENLKYGIPIGASVHNN